MIIFTINSISVLLGTIKLSDIEKHVFIFNDGLQTHHLKELVIKYEDFEVSGMYQRHEVGYKFHFHDGSMLEFTLTNGLIVVQSAIKIDIDKINTMPFELSEYYL